MSSHVNLVFVRYFDEMYVVMAYVIYIIVMKDMGEVLLLVVM